MKHYVEVRLRASNSATMILITITKKLMTEPNFEGRRRVTELGRRKRRDNAIYKSYLHGKKDAGAFDLSRAKDADATKAEN